MNEVTAAEAKIAAPLHHVTFMLCLDLCTSVTIRLHFKISTFSLCLSIIFFFE